MNTAVAEKLTEALADRDGELVFDKGSRSSPASCSRKMARGK
jgi:hypothetical protein